MKNKKAYAIVNKRGNLASDEFFWQYDVYKTKKISKVVLNEKEGEKVIKVEIREIKR